MATRRHQYALAVIPLLMAVACNTAHPRHVESEKQKTLCTALAMYTSDGTLETKMVIPDRFNHLWDETFERMGYNITPCPEAQIKLSSEMRLVSATGKVTVRVEGAANGRTNTFDTETSLAEYKTNPDLVYDKCGFAMAQVMEILDPGFKRRYHQVFRE